MSRPRSFSARPLGSLSLITAAVWGLVPSTAWAAGIERNLVINGTEVLMGLVAAALALQAALAYRSGRLGKGIAWVTVGLLVMTVGHVIMVVRRTSGMDPLGFLGSTGSFVGFSLAVFVSFVASAFGFWLIRSAATAE